MNVSSFVPEQALRQLKIPAKAIRQLQIAGRLSDVDGNGFPAELFQLSAPMVTRGLLNYAILQMKSDWLYPFWVDQQLNPDSKGFVARSQNPLLLNITNRNWTLLGSPNGLHEAIVDPRGLVTPLPREWSIDVWVATDSGILFPSDHPPVVQEYNTRAPKIKTIFEYSDHLIEFEAFVDVANHGRDVLFHRVRVTNNRTRLSDISVCIAIRPFNPEGAAPIQHIDYKHPKIFYIDRYLGLVLAEEPSLVACSNAENGDTAGMLGRIHSNGEINIKSPTVYAQSAACKIGLANAIAVYPISIQPGENRSLHYSIALGKNEELSRLGNKPAWRISFDRRSENHRQRWEKELSTGGKIEFADERLQNIFDANILTLLQLNDGDFISPGPYIYHNFWFRDAVPMVHALDRMGFHKRAQQVIDSFSERQTSGGYFKGPDGEWDSNGEVLWLIEQHMKYSRSTFRMKNYFSVVMKAAEWISRKRRTSKDSKVTHKGLMPPSLSAEHLGTVDQYYWDSFWSLAGIRSAAVIAGHLCVLDKKEMLEKEAMDFQKDIFRSLEKSGIRLGMQAIPASPSRPFDESAIGSICGIYPLELNAILSVVFQNTLDEITRRYVKERGFYHPIIHSGYNAYLTLHIAHSYLFLQEREKAWTVAEKVFDQCKSPYSLPEAVHPVTGGGSMGDGHHGWAAAEIVLFLIDCIVREEGRVLTLFKGTGRNILQWGKNISFRGIASSFGALNCTAEL